MAAKSNAYADDSLKLLYQATAIANVADNAGTSPLTDIYVAGHTAAPSASSDQTSNEIAYTSYARVAVARTSSGWSESSQSVSPVANISFPAGTGGSGTMAYASTGSASSGADVMFHFGTVTPNITTGNGVTPILSTSSSISES